MNLDFALLYLALPALGLQYLDPGIMGLLAQIGATVVMIAASVYIFFARPLKRLLRKVGLLRDESKDSKSSDTNRETGG